MPSTVVSGVRSSCETAAMIMSFIASIVRRRSSASRSASTVERSDCSVSARAVKCSRPAPSRWPWSGRSSRSEWLQGCRAWGSDQPKTKQPDELDAVSKPVEIHRSVLPGSCWSRCAMGERHGAWSRIPELQRDSSVRVGQSMAAGVSRNRARAGAPRRCRSSARSRAAPSRGSAARARAGRDRSRARSGAGRS